PQRRGSFPSQLFGNGQIRSGQCTNVASPTALKKYGSTYGTSPETTVGAGPFILKEWVKGDHITLVKNKGYWDGPRPYLDKLVSKVGKDNATQVNAVLSGTVQLANGYTWTTDVTRYKKAGYKVYGTPMSGAALVAFNPNAAPLNDIRVRQALTLASN